MNMLSQEESDIDVEDVNSTEKSQSEEFKKLKRKKRRKAAFRLGEYQTKNKETLEKKKLRRRKRKIAKSPKVLPDELHDDCLTWPYASSHDDNFDTASEGEQTMDVTDMCMEAMATSFQVTGNHENVNDSVLLQDVGNRSMLSNSDEGNLQSHNNTLESSHVDGNAIAEDYSDDDGSSKKSNFKDHCIKKLTNTNFVTDLVNKLYEHDCLNDFMIFLNLIVSGILAIKNLPFLLLLDLAKYLSRKNTSGMVYRPETKRFWETIYTFGGGTILRLLSGLKNFSNVFLKKEQRGYYDPNEGQVNFAVPDVKNVSKISTKYKGKIMPGFIWPNIERLNKNKMYNLCYDGKKIAPGCCENNEGDINLFGFEGPPNIEEQNRQLNCELKLVQRIIDKEKSCTDNLTAATDDLPKVLKIVTRRIENLRKSQISQEQLKTTFVKSMAQNLSSGKHYPQAIASIETFHHFSDVLIDKFLDANKKICHIMAQKHSTHNNFVEGSVVNLSRQGNTALLLNPQDIHIPDEEELLPEYVKQRSEQWFDLRKSAMVTGSTAYKALGLDTLKSQINHFKVYVSKEKDEVITPELQELFDHGQENEIHAFGTLAGIILPAFFHNCKKLLEVGAYFLDGDIRSKLVEVSPDALIKTLFPLPECLQGFHGSDSDVMVEFKSPFPKGKLKMPVHYIVPKYYVPQLLFEMKVLDLKLGLYVSCSKQSLVAIIVYFDEYLYEKIWSLTKKMFDHVTPKLFSKVALESKEISQLINVYVEEKTKLLCEVPTLRCIQGKLTPCDDFPVYSVGTENQVDAVSVEDIKIQIYAVCEEVKNIIRECYEMQRKKATEILLFVLNDTDRKYEDKETSAVPVAYLLKGYSLPVSVMRKLVNIVKNKLKDEGINVISESFDGQWCNLAFYSEEKKPLTMLQFQKCIWSKLGNISKPNLLKQIDNLTRVSTDDLQYWSSSYFLTVGSIAHGNLKVQFKGPANARSIHVWSMGGDSNVTDAITKIHTPSIDDRPDIWKEVQDYDEKRSNNDYDKDLLSTSHQDFNILTLLPSEFIQSGNLQNNEEMNVQNNEVFCDEHDVHSDNDDNIDDDYVLPDLPENAEQIIPTSDEIEHGLVHINPNILQQILVGLCSERRGEKWSSYSVSDLYEKVLINQKQIEQLTSYELDVIDHVIYTYTGKHLFRPENLKAHKVKMVCRLFGRKRDVHSAARTTTRHISLRKLALDVINDIDYPCNVLAVALANMWHEVEKPKWLSAATLPMNISLPGHLGIHECYSYPEFSVLRNKVEPKFLDPTHILTNVRTHICTRGYKDVSREAFVRVSKTDNKTLNRAYVTQVIDKQSAAIAMKFFSKDVEAILTSNGDVHEAEFCTLIRQWYQAVDERGIRVRERLQHLQDMYQYLRSKVDFNRYPPKKMYIHGIPIVTFESLLHDISSRIQLYHILNGRPFNHRSISTLSVETFFSLMSRMRGTYNGCPKATSLATMFETIVHMDELQSDPTNIFQVHVSHKKSYPDFPRITTESHSDNTSDSENDLFVEHVFDKPQNVLRKKRKRNDVVTTGNQQRKRICPVRIFFRPYEGKIKSTTRHGLQ